MATKRIDFHVLNVGQGAFNYVEIIDDAGAVAQNILIDLGTHSDRALSAGNITWLNDRIKGRADPRINVVLLTHGDADHYNLVEQLKTGLGDPAVNTRIGKVRYGGPQWRYKYHKQANTISFLEGYCTDVKACALHSSNYDKTKDEWESFWIGSDNDVFLRMVIANVPFNGNNLPAVKPAKKVKGEQVNTESLVSALVWNDTWIVATGDATGKTLAAANASLGAGAHATIEKTIMMTLPHHGSRKTTYDLKEAKGDIKAEWKTVVGNFIDIFKPKTLSISANEQYYHPSLDVIGDFSRHIDNTKQYYLDAETIGGGDHFLTAHILKSITAPLSAEWPNKHAYYTLQTKSNVYGTRYYDNKQFNVIFTPPAPPIAPAKTLYRRFRYPPAPGVDVQPDGGDVVDDVDEFTNWLFSIDDGGALTLTRAPDTAMVGLKNHIVRGLIYRRQGMPIAAGPALGVTRMLGVDGRLVMPTAITQQPAPVIRAATGAFRNLRVIP